MSIIESIILGIVQGIGEFLPISSSAHLILVRYLLGIELHSTDIELAFDVALHFGTLVAVVIVFWKDWLSLCMGAIDHTFKKKKNFEGKMFWYLVAATIPGAVVGLLFDDLTQAARENELLIAILLAVMGVLIYLGDKWAQYHYKIETDYKNMSFKQTFLIGMSQALAIIPGFSRSGTTMLTARLMGVSREGAAKFTFLLSVPIICGATILEVQTLFSNFSISILVGIITSAIVGILSIKFLLKYIQKNDFSLFAYYRVIFAIIVIAKLIIWG